MKLRKEKTTAKVCKTRSFTVTRAVGSIRAVMMGRLLND